MERELSPPKPTVTVTAYSDHAPAALEGGELLAGRVERPVAIHIHVRVRDDHDPVEA
jgi:hypothetical protein